MLNFKYPNYDFFRQTIFNFFLKTFQTKLKNFQNWVNTLSKSQYFILICVLITIFSWWFWPFTYLILVSQVFKVFLKKIPKNIKSLLLVITLTVASIVNFVYLNTYLELELLEKIQFPVNIYYLFYWIVELAHFTMFASFFYCCYRILRYSFTAYSNLYVGFYIGIHSLYNGCPITLTQNFLLQNSGKNTSDSSFWNGLFTEKTELVRWIFLILCIFLIYWAFLQLQKWKIKKKFFFTFTLENAINRNQVDFVQEK